jgi:hypothetical protein
MLLTTFLTLFFTATIGYAVYRYSDIRMFGIASALLLILLGVISIGQPEGLTIQEGYTETVNGSTTVQTPIKTEIANGITQFLQLFSVLAGTIFLYDSALRKDQDEQSLDQPVFFNKDFENTSSEDKR